MKQEEKDMCKNNDASKNNKWRNVFVGGLIGCGIIFAVACGVLGFAFNDDNIAFIATVVAFSILGSCAMICTTMLQIKEIQDEKDDKASQEPNEKLIDKVLKANLPEEESCKKEINVNIGLGKSKR